MNEERLKQILKIDAQAQALYDQALSETDAIPAQAEEQVRLLIESTRKQAQEDAAKLVDEICDPQSIENILEKNKKWVVDKNKFKSKSGNTPFNGYELYCKPYCVINKDQIFYCKV